MATDAPPPDDLDPSHVLPAQDWAAVEAERAWIEQMKTPLTPAEVAELAESDAEVEHTAGLDDEEDDDV